MEGGFNTHDVLLAWRRVLTGSVPLLSIEITRECPLHCPGCYAYGETHLGNGPTLRQLSDFRGDQLVNGILALVRRHRPLHVSLVGGEPLVRHRELSRILPALSAMRVWSMVVTSAVIPIPMEWQDIPRVTIAVSVDGLPEHHNVRRQPATYDRILKNISGRKVNIHLTITGQMMQRDGYLEEYFEFWNQQPEVQSIWVSTYTPQVGERTPEMLTRQQREAVSQSVDKWRRNFPRIIMDSRTRIAFLHPPRSPQECPFAQLSVNYSADLKSRVEPCIFGGTPDCAQCGCAISIGLHAVQQVRVAGFITVSDLVKASTTIGSVVNRFRPDLDNPVRWKQGTLPTESAA